MVKIVREAPRDSFSRKIDYMRVSVTDKCNLRCRYCMPEEGIDNIPHDDIMCFEEIELLVKAAVGIGFKKVRITGGEPLVRRDITTLIKMVRAVHGLNDLSLTTNGVLLSEMARSLKESGIDRVNISLDTLRPERFKEITRRDDFLRVISGVDEALGVGMDPVKINVVVIRDFNDDEIMDFVELTRERPLSVRFIEYMPVSSLGKWSRSKLISSSELMDSIKQGYELIPLEEKNGAGPSQDYTIPGYRGTVGFITPVTRHFCEECNRIRVTADGRIRSCLFSDDENYILPLLREGRGLKEIGDFILNSLETKPYCHNIDSIQFKSCQRSMSKIGG